MMAQPANVIDRLALVWMRADGTELEFPVWPERPVTIGRDVTNAVALESGFVSKNHAILQYVDGEFVLEDLRSANGTRVNGAAIETATVAPGDELEIGDQRLAFVDRSAAHSVAVSKGLGKTGRLALAALGTLVVLGIPALLLRPAPEGMVTAEAAPTVTAPGAAPATSAEHLITAIADRARIGGIRLEEALLDEAFTQERNGRLLESEALFATLLSRAPEHALAKVRLPQVAIARERAVQGALADGQRSVLQLRYADAVRSFERVLALTTERDERRSVALQGLKAAQDALRR